MRRTGPLATLLAVVTLLLAACGGGDGQVQRRDAGSAGFVGGTGLVTTVSASERTAPADFSAPLLDGNGSVDLASWRGDVVVLNVWGSWCAPCRAEAPDLERAWEQLRSRDVRFLGVNTRDRTDQARGYVAQFGLTYPSVVDDSGAALLAFRHALPPNAIPSTLVLDRQGRVAARVSGEVDTSTVVGMVHDVLAEPKNAA